jgi:hypothetical protein
MFCQPGYNFFMQQLGNSEYNYLEIGIFNGDSVANLARAFPARTIFGIDPFIEDGATVAHTGVKETEFMPTQHENTMNNIAGLNNIVLFEIMSSEFSNMLTDEMIVDMNVAWVLIDGSHHYADVVNDVDLAMRLIGNRSGGVVFDDVNLPGVGQAYNEFLTKYAGCYSVVQDIYSLHPGHILAHRINHD